MLLRLIVTSLVLFFATSCVERTDVTHLHPYRARLLGPSTTSKPLYLHKDEDDPRIYRVSYGSVVSYSRDSNGSQIKNTYLPDIVLPPKSRIVVERIDFVQAPMLSNRTDLVGKAYLPGSNTPIPIQAMHERIRFDNAKWEREHFFLSLPKPTDYMKNVEKGTLPW